VTAGSLDAFLAGMDAERNSLVTPSGFITIGEMRDAAWKLAAEYQFSRRSRLALCGLFSVELITALIAFDGVVDSMLLLPASLDEGTIAVLMESAESEWRITNLQEGPYRVGDAMAAGNEGVQPTRWILATSGTTGVPKLIEHTLETLCRTVKRDSNRGVEFVWGLLYDPCRFAGLQVVLQALLSGSLLSIPQTGKITDHIEFFSSCRVNALSATPSLWRKLLMSKQTETLPLCQITLGGEIADQGILDALKYAYPGARITHIYASTEAGSAFAVQDGRAGFPAQWLDHSSAPVMLRVSDDGHLLLRPALLPAGEEVRSRIDTNGYLDTEDLVRVEGDRVYFLGRVSGAINVGGNKVTPEEVENHIRKVSGVLDVRVFGKRSSILGEIVTAEVVASTGYDVQELQRSIQKYCRSQMENWQVPAMISFVPALAVNAAGKRERCS